MVNRLDRLPQDPGFKFLVVAGAVGVLAVLGFLIHAGGGKLLLAFAVAVAVVLVPFLFSREVREALKAISAGLMMVAGIGVLALLALAVFLVVAVLLNYWIA